MTLSSPAPEVGIMQASFAIVGKCTSFMTHYRRGPPKTLILLLLDAAATRVFSLTVSLRRLCALVARHAYKITRASEVHDGEAGIA